MSKNLKLIIACLCLSSTLSVGQNEVDKFNFRDKLIVRNKTELIKKLKIKSELELSVINNKIDTSRIIYYSSEGTVDSIYESSSFVPTRVEFSISSRSSRNADELFTKFGLMIHGPKPPSKYYSEILSDSLTIVYDSLDKKVYKIITEYDDEKKIFNHYQQMHRTGKVHFRNISRFNDDGQLLVASIIERKGDSYVVQYYYNDKGQRISETILVSAKNKSQTKEYSYLDNGLLDFETIKIETFESSKVEHKYEYYSN